MLVVRTSLGKVGPLRRVYRRWAAARRGRDLRRFHDVLDSGPLAGRWQLWAGVVLGLERSGDILKWDRDIDVLVSREHFDAFVSTIETLRCSGFLPFENFVGNDGRLIGVHLLRHGFIYDFFIAERVIGTSGTEMVEFKELVTKDGSVWEQTGRIPRQQLRPVPAWGRGWPCSSDIPLELEYLYGPSWREPDPDWNASKSPYVVASEPYRRCTGTWTALEQTPVSEAAAEEATGRR